METTKEMKKKNQETLPEVKKQQAIAAAAPLPEDLQGAWGAEEATGEDIIIPKLLLMHGQSKLVQKGDHNIGELVKSTTGELLAGKKDKILVIPFQMWKSWRISELDEKGQAQWRGEEAWTTSNTDADWEYEKDGKKMRRDRSYNFYGILVKDIEKDEAFPIRLSFVRTSKKAGHQIADFFAQCKAKKVPPASQVWEIGSEAVERGGNTYQTFTSRAIRKTEMKELQICKFWYDQLRLKKDHIKNDEDNDDLSTTSSHVDPNSDSAEY